VNWIRFPGGDEDVPDGEMIPAWPLDDVLAAAAAAGFRDVGLDDLTVAGADPEEVAALLRSHGLVCTDVGVLRVGAGEIRPQAGVCIAALYTPTPAEALADLRTASAVLAAAGVRIALEFAPYGGLPTLSDAIDVCAAVGWNRCGLLVDTWHFFRSDEPWSLLRSLDADQIALVHVNDAPASERDLVYESRFRRLPVGSGTFAIDEFAAALAATGYDGVLSTEVLSSALRRRPPADGARELLESLHRSWPVDPLRTVEMN
jgi:sugar phosphate isomerase/epimerase